MFTSLDGSPGPFGGNALASNGRLHDAALSFLGSVPDDGTDPDVVRRGPGSVHDLSARRRPPAEAEEHAAAEQPGPEDRGADRD